MKNPMAESQLSLTDVNQYLRHRTNPSLPLAEALCTYVLAKPGKQMRAQIVLLAAQTGEINHPKSVIQLSAIIELIHNATLLHDDVIDHAEERRFQTAAHQVWDNTSAILAGDYLYGLAFEMMTELNHMPILTHLAKATQRIVQGEMHQHVQKRDINTSYADYMVMIGAKTAELFSVASYTSALLVHTDPNIQKALQNYGRQLGLAFQMKDDLLDYAPQKQTGKSAGQDLKEGKITLPLITAYQRASTEQKAILKQATENPSDAILSEVETIFHQTSSWQHCTKILQNTIEQAISALAPLPDSNAKEALIAMAEYNGLRDH